MGENFWFGIIQNHLGRWGVEQFGLLVPGGVEDLNWTRPILGLVDSSSEVRFFGITDAVMTATSEVSLVRVAAPTLY